MTALVARRRAMGEDRGSTLLELMVGMLIMMIFLGMFSGAIVLLYQSSNRANALTTSASQTDSAFAHLDKTVRYASAISTPGTSATGWYVEFLSTASGVATCTQLRVTVTTQQLQARSWPAGTATATAWVPWASGITNGNAAAGSTTVPFTLITNGTNVPYEQLAVNLTATSGSPAITAQTKTSFTALNSAVAAKAAGVGTSSVCVEVARP